MLFVRMASRAATLLIFLFSSAATCGSTEFAINLQQSTYMQGLPFTFTVDTPDNEIIDVHFIACGIAHEKINVFYSRGRYQPERQRVDPFSMPALEGTYHGVNAFGLLNSGQATAIENINSELYQGFNPRDLQQCKPALIVVTRNNIVLSRRQVPIEIADASTIKNFADATSFTTKEHGFRGLLLSTKTKHHQRISHKKPALLVLGGVSPFSPSEVDIPELLDYALSGYVVLGVEYYGHEGQPRYAKKVPLEQFERAYQTLSNREHVDAKRIGIIGTSGGAEAAVLITSLSPQVKPKTAVLISSPFYMNGTCSFCIMTQSARWTYRGKSVPYLKVRLRDFIRGVFTFQSRNQTYYSRHMVKDRSRQTLDRARLPLQHLDIPILMIGGEKDQLTMTPEMIRYFCKGLPCDDKRIKGIIYPDAGHSFTGPNWNLSCSKALKSKWIDGTCAGNVKASTDAYFAIKGYLQEQLSDHL